MCSASGASAGLGIVQNVLGAAGSAEAQYNQQMAEYQNAQARWEIEKRQADERQKMLNANAILQLQQIQNRQVEVNEAAVSEKSDIAIAAMRAKAAAELSAGEANISGRSVDQILSGIETEAQVRIGKVEASRQNQIRATQMDKLNTIQSTKTMPIYGVLPSEPDYDGSGIFSALLSGIGNLDFSGFSSSRCSPKTSTRCGS